MDSVTSKGHQRLLKVIEGHHDHNMLSINILIANLSANYPPMVLGWSNLILFFSRDDATSELPDPEAVPNVMIY